MQQRTCRGFLAGALLGATLALTGMAAADTGNGGADNGGMMQNGKMDGGMMMQDGMMASMQKMMGQCSDMMTAMQERHEQQAGESNDAS